MMGKAADPQIAEAAWQNFKPATPLTAAGGVFAGTGFLGGWGLLVALSALLRAPFRRWRARAA